MMLLIDTSATNKSTVDKLVERAEQGLEERGATRTTEKFEGTELVVWTEERTPTTKMAWMAWKTPPKPTPT